MEEEEEEMRGGGDGKRRKRITSCFLERRTNDFLPKKRNLPSGFYFVCQSGMRRGGDGKKNEYVVLYSRRIYLLFVNLKNSDESQNCDIPTNIGITRGTHHRWRH